MDLRNLYTKAKALLDMGVDPSSVVIVKPRELGDLFVRGEVTNVAPGKAPLSPASTEQTSVVLVEFRGATSFVDYPHPH